MRLNQRRLLPTILVLNLILYALGNPHFFGAVKKYCQWYLSSSERAPPSDRVCPSTKNQVFYFNNEHGFKFLLPYLKDIFEISITMPQIRPFSGPLEAIYEELRRRRESGKALDYSRYSECDDWWYDVEYGLRLQYSKLGYTIRRNATMVLRYAGRFSDGDDLGARMLGELWIPPHTGCTRSEVMQFMNGLNDELDDLEKSRWGLNALEKDLRIRVKGMQNLLTRNYP